MEFSGVRRSINSKKIGTAFIGDWNLVFITRVIGKSNEGRGLNMLSKWKTNSTGFKEAEFYAPVTGEAVALAAVPDEAFAGGYMGKGMAIEPSEGKLIAPFGGTAVHVIKSKHAVILEHPSGLQMLFHIGINTVSLKGEGFITHVRTGDTVKAGQTLIEFDIDKIKGAGYPVITSVIATNADELTEDIETYLGPVQSGSDVILKAIFKA